MEHISFKGLISVPKNTMLRPIIQRLADRSAKLAGEGTFYLVAYLHVHGKSAGPFENGGAQGAGVGAGVHGAILGVHRLFAIGSGLRFGDSAGPACRYAGMRERLSLRAGRVRHRIWSLFAGGLRRSLDRLRRSLQGLGKSLQGLKRSLQGPNCWLKLRKLQARGCGDYLKQAAAVTAVALARHFGRSG